MIKFYISDISRFYLSYFILDFGMYMISRNYSSVKVQFLTLIDISDGYMQRLV